MDLPKENHFNKSFGLKRKRNEDFFEKRKKSYFKKIDASEKENIKWTNDEVSQLFQALQKIPLYESNFWFKVSKLVNGKTPDECYRFYLLSSNQRIFSTNHDNSQDTTLSFHGKSPNQVMIEKISKQLQQQKSNSKTLTKKRLFRDLLDATSNHREDLFNHPQKRKFVSNSDFSFLDENDENSNVNDIHLKNIMEDCEENIINQDQFNTDSPNPKRSKIYKSEDIGSIVTPLKLKKQQNNTPSPLGQYISPAVIRQVSMKHVDTLTNKISKQQSQKNFSLPIIKMSNSNSRSNVNGIDLFESFQLNHKDTTNDIDSDEEIDEYFSDVDEDDELRYYHKDI